MNKHRNINKTVNYFKVLNTQTIKEMNPKMHSCHNDID